MKLKVKVIEPKKKGQKKLKFRVGGLHQSTNTPMGEKIPEAKREAALEGKYGAKAKMQANFAKNVLHH